MKLQCVCHLLLICFGFAYPLVQADDALESLRLDLRHKQTSAFAGQSAVWTLKTESDLAANSQLIWTYTVNNRTLAQGSVPFQISEKSATAKFRLRLPTLNPGITSETVLTATIHCNETVVEQYQQTVWLFADSAFTDRHKWLDSLQLKLLDPSGSTAKVLRENRIPIERINEPPDSARPLGIILVGEGLSLKRNAQRARQLLQAAARGAHIVWIAPEDGKLPFPDENIEGLTGLTSLSFRREDVIRDQDKRLNPLAWQLSGQPTSRFRVFAERKSRVVLQSTFEPTDWPWVELRFASGGRLVLCGMPLISTWDAGPESQYVLLGLLESMSQQNAPTGP